MIDRLAPVPSGLLAWWVRVLFGGRSVLLEG